LPPKIAGEESSDADLLQPLTAILRKCSAIINLMLPVGKRLIKKPDPLSGQAKGSLALVQTLHLQLNASC
jgi:hypothetical protein